jgi:WD40 repeat protein/tetratricopeptide (TPR) repeat protein
MDRLIVDMERLSATQAATARQRLDQRFADVIQNRIARPTFTRNDLAPIEAHLDLLAVRAPDLVPSLRQVLEQRLRLQRITELQDAFKAGLEVSEWTAGHLDKLDELLAELERLSADQAVARTRLDQRFADSMRASIQKPTLLPDEIARFEANLKLLAGRAPALVPPLREAIDRRLRVWEKVIDLTAPFDEFATVLDPARVKVEADRLALGRVGSGPGGAATTILTAVPSPGSVQFDAVFHDWETASRIGLLLNVTPGHTQRVHALAPSPDGLTLATAGSDGSVRLWDLPSGRVRARLSDHPVLALAFSMDGKRLLTVGPTVRCWESSSGKELPLAKPIKGQPVSATMTSDGTLLATGQTNGDVLLWNPEAGESLGKLTGLSGRIAALAISPDRQWLAAGSLEGMTRIWNLATRQEHRTLAATSRSIRALAFSSDGRLLATGGSEDQVKIWDIGTGQLHKTLEHKSGITALVFAPKGPLLLTAGSDRRLKRWDLHVGGMQSALPGRGSGPVSLGFAPDGESLFVGNGDGSTTRWNAALEERGYLSSHAYAFTLRGLEALAPEGDPRRSPASQSFRKVRQEGGEIVLEILRDGVPLRESRSSARELPEGLLHVQVSREGQHLTFQVQVEEPGGRLSKPIRLMFQDLFPIGGPDPGVFALHWPGGVRLKRLQGRHQSLPVTPSPLEQGDDLFSRGEYGAAQEQYRTQAAEAGSREISQQARYKQALCLLGLNRQEEAAELLQQVANEVQDDPNNPLARRWSVVAACQLWLMYLRQDRLTEAGAVFESLTARFPKFEILLPLIPQDLLADILDAYHGSAHSLNLYRPAPNRTANLERAITVENYVRGSTRVHPRRMHYLCRSYQLDGQHEQAFERMQAAVRMLEPTYLNWDSDYGVINDYIWLLRVRGQPKQSLQEVDYWLYEKPGVYRPGSYRRYLLLERARSHAALEQWREAEQDIEALFQDMPAEVRTLHYAECCLLRGFIREQRGDHAGALEAWKMGVPPDDQFPRLTFGFEFVFKLFLMSLTDQLTDARAEQLWSIILGGFGGESAVTALNAVFRVPPALLREAWRSPRGQQYARAYAFRSVPFPELIRVPPLLLVNQLLHQGALPDQVTPEMDDYVWGLVENTYLRFMAGKFTTGHVVAFGLTWKGTINFPGWTVLNNSLEPADRGPLAYVYGHRYLRLKRPDDALMFFRTARKDAAAGSVLSRLAQAELDRLEKK